MTEIGAAITSTISAGAYTGEQLLVAVSTLATAIIAIWLVRYVMKAYKEVKKAV